MRSPVLSAKSGTLIDNEDGMFVTGLVQGVPVKFLVDTGANITILQQDYLEKIPVSDRPALNQEGSSIALADGRALPFICQGTFSLQVGTTEGDHQVWIADIEPEGILGLDFLRSRKCQLVLQEGQYELICTGTEVDPKLGTVNPACYRVAVSETTVIPPRSETLVPGSILDFDRTNAGGLLQPTARLMEEKRLLLARTLVEMDNEVVPLRVLNSSERPLTMYKGTIAAWCEPISEVVSQQKEKKSVSMCRPTSQLPEKVDFSGEAHSVVPDYLEDLLLCSSENLGTEKEKIAALLCEYSDIFSSCPDDIGRTGKAQHRIQTGESKPIRQQARRLPMHKRQEAEEQTQQMHDKRVIEPSSSPWASPIVLVKKKDGSTRFCVDYRRSMTLRSKIHTHCQESMTRLMHWLDPSGLPH